MPALDSVDAEGQKSPALHSLEVEGYKSIRSAKIDLGAINVLIGANGSGKSNLVGLFSLLADLADHRLQLHIARQGGADAILHFGRKMTSRLRISLSFAPLEYEAILVPSAGDTLVFGSQMAGIRRPVGRAVLRRLRPRARRDQPRCDPAGMAPHHGRRPVHRGLALLIVPAKAK
jgi:hypothetical protein